MSYFLFFLVTLFIIAAYLRVEFFFTLLYLFLIVYLLARVWARRSLVRLRTHRQYTDHAFFGDQVLVDAVVQNASWLPVPWLELHESLPVQLTTPPFHRAVVSLGSREKTRFQYTLHCRQRGYYAIGPLTLQTGDLLGMIGRSQVQLPPQTIIVYPQILPLHQLGLPTHSPMVALPATSHLFEDPTRVMGVRDYQQGDSPRRIHWTATASADRLLVKQYQPSIARETLICLDLNEDDYGARQRLTATELSIASRPPSPITSS